MLRYIQNHALGFQVYSLCYIYACFVAHLHKIFGDPDAADIVFTSGADVLAVGINVTHQVVLTGTFSIDYIITISSYGTSNILFLLHYHILVPLTFPAFMT